MTAPTHLRVEHLDDALGTTVARPRLSWCLPAGTKKQVAYRVRAGQWDSGRVDSDQSLLVPYGGETLRSGERVHWTVKVWTDAGESEWAAQAWWEMGLLDATDWVTSWIGPPEDDMQPVNAVHPVWYLRGSSTLTGPIVRARLYVTAHGIYEFFINGVRVGDTELTPGFTSYRSRLQVHTFDVTDLLRTGENVLGAILSGGWIKWAPSYRDIPLGLLAQLQVLDVDGSASLLGTGPDWTTATGAIQTADLQQGQVEDLRKHQVDWCLPGSDGESWVPVTPRDFGLAHLSSSPAPPVRRVQELRPVSISQLRADRQIVDLGQNINGWIRIANVGPAGTTLTLTHGETLDAASDVTLANVTPPDKTGPFQQDQVTSAGRSGEHFEPRHATKGFRYVRVEGHPTELSIDDITGIVVQTDMRRTGWFECSNERLNKLHEAIVWSMRGNTCDIPTDCPTRERAGWTGDWQIFAPTAAFLFDIAGFSTKWLRDLATDQLPDGLVRHCAPEFTPLATQVSFSMPPGCAGFADAALIVPWEIYQAYGDRDLLEQQWSSMTAWVDYAARAARQRRHNTRIAARPVPEPHEQYLWDTGFHWGEWNEPDMPLEIDLVRDFVAQMNTADHGNIATAYLHHSAHLLTRIATVLDREEDMQRYENLAVATRNAWQREFLKPDGRIAPHTQANYVRGLAFDLVPPELRTQAAGHLVDLIRKADNHLGTGFLATPFLLPVLADNGYLDVAYELLLQDTPPSWLAMIDRGATTIWEHWSGIDDDGVPLSDAGAGVGSLNHYSKGAVASFLHRYVAGIQLGDEPAYRHFRIAPQHGGGLTSARAAHDSPYGRIETSWNVHGDLFVLDVSIPTGTTATICLPDGQTFDADPGTARHMCTIPEPQVALARPQGVIASTQ